MSDDTLYAFCCGRGYHCTGFTLFPSLAKTGVKKCTAYSVRTKPSTHDLLVKTSGVKTEVVEVRGDVVRGLEQLTMKAVGFKEQDGFLQLKMWIFKNKMMSYTRRKWLVGQAD